MAQLKIALVVIVYGKTLQQSLTIQDLLKFKYPLHQLLIVNNGPEAILEHDSCIQDLGQIHQNVTLQNQLQNKPLSWIYNDFIQSYDADYYVLFDDDTEINEQYQDVLFHLKNVDFELPEIRARCDLKPRFPMMNSQLLQHRGEIIEPEKIYSVGSGLIISHRIKEFFKDKNMEIFDSNFAFYGVDTTFFTRINQFIKQGYKFKFSSMTYLNHCLSLTEESLTTWRKNEFIYENVLTLKYYSSSQWSKNLKFIKLVFRKIIKLSFRDAFLIIKVFFKGKHPRCEI
ncbi:glycosyltransferase family 2 protein [Acinetobacter sp. MB5]|uniref:glycosyltransferase family 2 protein n=1 Tax=Acinetobacter sp. MB5 TaxID=2069438 RepID=UPI000DD09B40|nr:glycosyl transferase [Acinetobacter sp. MB5]